MMVEHRATGWLLLVVGGALFLVYGSHQGEHTLRFLWDVVLRLR